MWFDESDAWVLNIVIRQIVVWYDSIIYESEIKPYIVIEAYYGYRFLTRASLKDLLNGVSKRVVSARRKSRLSLLG
jgi:predicted SPOUT superfamily RNA methylase MTH1